MPEGVGYQWETMVAQLAQSYGISPAQAAAWMEKNLSPERVANMKKTAPQGAGFQKLQQKVLKEYQLGQ